jgi:hypothetical protein
MPAEWHPFGFLIDVVNELYATTMKNRVVVTIPISA